MKKTPIDSCILGMLQWRLTRNPVTKNTKNQGDEREVIFTFYDY